ncbi:magnesium chelatase [Oscillospiraceae bacterium]|nr:magnesium chelatase [Oscillospiraceae bacterium]BDF76661.1 magnesium chelatase [Oscillospiraceae bacterium]
MMERYEYPFTALVGQEDLKTALLLNLVDPRLGGVLIRGEKGTAKSTAVRGLAALLDEVEVVEGCPFHCRADGGALCDACSAMPQRRTVSYRRRVVELPVSATEDRVVGSLDLERALKEGVKAFEPGLLAQANGNILYVDEINLLEDHIVDVLLDSAAMGVNTVEREGVSYSHPARFILVGTMNPEEGDLRPQLLDRFGLVAEVRGEPEADARKEVVRRRLAFEDDPAAFCAGWEREQESLRGQIQAAQLRLGRVTLPDALFDAVARVCTQLQVDGHRADITMIKTARALAALEGREEAGEGDLRRAAALALPHRLRRAPFEEAGPVKLDWEALLHG